MKLSIGMIVKNEAHNLRECLTCLQPVLTRVDSELIIADTGSEDETAAIAKEFTPHVMEIAWNDNFSEAREHTLRAAKGEWFMYLDADDFFEKTDDLIQFFNSNEYAQYNCAAYEIHQYHYSKDELLYVTTNAIRMAKITEKTRFENIIHETLVVEPPCRHLTSCTRHTGNAYDSDPDRKKRKHDLYVSLLLRKYRSNPLDLHNIALIVNEYMAFSQLDECRQYIDIGLSHTGHDSSSPFFHLFYHKLAVYHAYRGKPDDLARIVTAAGEYLSKLDHLSVTAIDMLYFLGAAHYQLQRYAAAADAFQQCYDLIKLHRAGRLDTAEEAFVMVQNTGEASQLHVARVLADCYGKMLGR